MAYMRRFGLAVGDSASGLCTGEGPSKLTPARAALAWNSAGIVCATVRAKGGA